MLLGALNQRYDGLTKQTDGPTHGPVSDSLGQIIQFEAYVIYYDGKERGSFPVMYRHRHQKISKSVRATVSPGSYFFLVLHVNMNCIHISETRLEEFREYKNDEKRKLNSRTFLS